MAKLSFKSATWTPTAVADATNFTDNGYMGLMGGSTTQRLSVIEIYMGGQAATSAPCIMIFSRDSTVQATPTALTTGQSNAALDPSTAALAAPPVAFTASTTKPQRSATLGLLNLSFNAFGGIVRWIAAPGEEIGVLGNTASLGEVSLSAYTGGTVGLMGAHIIYEPL
jgi:hypothetical protein